LKQEQKRRVGWKNVTLRLIKNRHCAKEDKSA